MAAKAAKAAECAHARDELYEPWEMSPREKELATKYIKLIQGWYQISKLVQEIIKISTRNIYLSCYVVFTHTYQIYCC